MKTTAKRPASRLTIGLNKTKTFFSKPYNVILLLMGIVFTVTTIAPIVAIVQDTLKIHPGTIDAHLQEHSFPICSILLWKREGCGHTVHSQHSM